MSAPAASPPTPGAAPVAKLPPVDEGPSDAEVLMLAAKPGERLFRVLEEPDPLRPLLAVLAVLPAVLAAPRCRLDRIDPDWGVTCLEAYGGDPISVAGPAAWLTGQLLRLVGTDGAMPYFALSWAGATLLVWAVWQLTYSMAGGRPAAFAAVLTATNPVTAAAAATAPPTSLGVAFAVIAAWLWVRAGRIERRGAAAGVGVLLAGPFAGLLPAAVVVVTVGLKLIPGAQREVPRRDRLPATLNRAGLFSIGLLAAGTTAAFMNDPPSAWEAERLPVHGLWLLAGLAAAGTAATLGGQLWIDSVVRRVVLGLVASTAVWAGLTGAHDPDAGTLSALVTAAITAAIAVEGACRPAVSPRGIAALACVALIVLLGMWVWTPSTVATVWRALFVAAAATGLWGLWEVAAFRWSRNVRDRRLLIVAIVALAATGLGWAVEGTESVAGRGARQLVAAVSNRPEPRVFVLAEAPDQQAAKFLFSAAAPGRMVFVLDPDSPQVADSLNKALSVEPSPLVAVVGGGPAARLNALRPAGAAPPTSAGVLRGADGVMKEVRLLVLPGQQDTLSP
ncbi:glycosyltransferase family 39 protein [Alienimonas chondri]|uniref:Glycosyltransferase RgtA/B/C/D-like domain-containing protein n=1 Tax=Alienimonas chondri TaxID=2681879 RepID=A0ABX1VA38_9PLAN|nr:glycosyltransferase family 39 protein [Alienimonas chondri]NNJ24742.1 hypothetical protein [Alienimonas chondri]